MSAKKKKRLRSGFTTGTAAAAAVKGALMFLMEGRPPIAVHVDFLTEGGVTIPIKRVERISPTRALCIVIKDAGDDPDVTHRAEIGAEVELGARVQPANGTGLIHIGGGKGVGTVTKAGLEVPPGEPAINPGPRRMIIAAVNAVMAEQGRAFDVRVRIFVPQGEALARKTLNARLGIVGGISILGTTGIVRPMSHEAYTATIRSALSVAAASGARTVVLTTGRRSERFAQKFFPDFPEERFVQIGDYFRFALQSAADLDFSSVILTVFFGKALKMAQGIPHTHAAKSTLVLDRLAAWTHETTGDDRLTRAVGAANTARQAFEILAARHLDVILKVGERIVKAATAFGDHKLAVRSIILNYDGEVVSDTAAKRQRVDHDRH
ncbi:MAG: cobalt-precorrin-5B (C(1))-methyltransferase [Desulfosarcina sp.]|nr:cobalt-precorrin-5B (C(1))-methyltransferase [Desulfobacterales bacterium]